MDINKVIMESLQDVMKEGYTDPGGDKGLPRATAPSATHNVPSVGAELSPAEKLVYYAKQAGKSGKEALVKSIKENPGKYGFGAGAAAALAAGLGALALRKKLASAKVADKKKK